MFELETINKAVPSNGSVELPELDQDIELEQPWNVVVHNDPVNLMSYVVKVFVKVLEFSHTCGRFTKRGAPSCGREVAREANCTSSSSTRIFC